MGPSEALISAHAAGDRGSCSYSARQAGGLHAQTLACQAFGTPIDEDRGYRSGPQDRTHGLGDDGAGDMLPGACIAGCLSRHSPDDIQIRGNCTTGPPPRELHPSAAIRWPDFGDRLSSGRPFDQIFRHSDTPFPSFSLGRRYSSTYAGAGLRRRSSIRLRIFRNSSLDTATSANWKVTYPDNLSLSMLRQDESLGARGPIRGCSRASEPSQEDA